MLVLKDEAMHTSAVYVAALILKLFYNQKATRLSLFDIAKELKKFKITHYRQLVFGLSFLYVSGTVEFNEPYVYIT